MTTSNDLLGLTKAALLGLGVDANPVVYATDAENRIFRPGDWPTWGDVLPATKVRVVSEEKISMGKGGFKFVVTATIRILSQVDAPIGDQDNGGDAAEQALWRIARQNELAVINSYPLFGLLQDIPFIRSALAFNTEGEKPIAAIQTDIGMEFVQTEEDFYPNETDPLLQIDVEDTAHPGAGFTVNLPQ